MNTEIIEMKEKKETFNVPLLPVTTKVPAKLLGPDILTLEQQAKNYRTSRIERVIKSFIAVKYIGELK